ncbi:MAG: GGDEF domain-containing protein [Devosia sp.]|nr:GGDEF domain-containing protein [Devosia sp.]
MAQHYLAMSRPGRVPGPGLTGATRRRTDPEPARLLILSFAALCFVAATVVGAALYAVQTIDHSAVSHEMERARVALSVLTTGGATPGAEMAARIAHDYLLEDARFVPAGSEIESGAAIPVPGTGFELAWSPRLLGSEVFMVLAPLRLIVSAIFLGGVAYLVYRMYGITRLLDERRRQAQTLAAQDSLTGLGNRLAFDQRLEAAFASGRGAALLYLDLDGFKQVNDTLGHSAGDQLLQIVATRLGRLAGETDLVVRIGGDEFGILRTSPCSREGLAELAADVGLALGAPFELGGKVFGVKASIGIALAPDDAETSAELVRAADEALYRAKATRGGFTFAQTARLNG